jgi:hypothetical protein
VSLVSVKLSPVVCLLWRLRIVPDGEPHPIGANCIGCGRDLALRRHYAKREAICLYCAMDRGIIPLVELPPDDERWPDEVQE